MNTLRDRAGLALKDAMRARDREAVSALRTVLGALSNAEAVPVDRAAGAVEAAPSGAGSTEAPRRVLTDEEARAVVVAELADLDAAVDQLTGLGDHGAAARLDHRRETLRSLLG